MLVLGVLSANALGELTAEQCAVVYNRNSEASESVARHYARVRGVPADQLLGLGVRYREQVSRETYETKIVPKVREWLTSHENGSRIRCLVTCYDLPLKVASHHATEANKVRSGVLGQELVQAGRRVRDLILRIRDRSDAPAGRQGSWGKIEDDASLDDLYRLFLEGQRALINQSPGADAKELSERRRAALGFVYAAEGRTGIIARGSTAAEQLGHATTDQMGQIRDRVVELERRIGPLIAYKSSASDFDAALKDVRESRGLFGLARVLRSRMTGLVGRDSKSSFDSELALVLRGRYSPAGWVSNPLYGKFGEEAIGVGVTERVLIVSRLDGPTVKLVHRMIDTTVAVEKTGLDGNVYIDARGLRKDDGYIDYDRDLIRLASMLRKKSEMPLTLDRKGAVFQAGECPRAAVYCGWYNVKSYVDAFDFVPGAVGYHIASFELVSLRDETKRFWCKELLKDGVVATLGAVNEPYLSAFPKPTAFFGLLMTGEYSLGEVFAATQPFLSWQMALIGDPLYRPFMKNPQMPAGWLPAWN